MQPRAKHRLLELRPLLPATALSLLLATAIWLSMAGSRQNLATLLLHYPLFLMISWVGVHAIRRAWWNIIAIGAFALALVAILV